MNIAMNDQKQRLAVMNNQDAESHVASDLWSLGNDTVRKAMESRSNDTTTLCRRRT